MDIHLVAADSSDEEGEAVLEDLVVGEDTEDDDARVRHEMTRGGEAKRLLARPHLEHVLQHDVTFRHHL